MKKVFILAVGVLLVCGLAGCTSASNPGNGEEISQQAVSETVKTETGKEPSPEELEQLLLQQPVVVTSTEYKVQDEEYKNLYPDMLSAVFQNNTTVDIKNAVVVFAAWDANNLPVKIKGKLSFKEGSYLPSVNYSDINLVPGASYGDKSGYEIDEDNGIVTIKAIVKSYEDFEGNKWENPCYKDFAALYEGKKLSK